MRYFLIGSSVILFIFLINLSAKDINGFLDIPWGADIDAIKVAYSKEDFSLAPCNGREEHGHSIHTQCAVVDATLFGRHQFVLLFFLSTDGLYRVEATGFITQDTPLQYQQAFSDVGKELEQRYGKPNESTKTEHLWQDPKGKIELEVRNVSSSHVVGGAMKVLTLAVQRREQEQGALPSPPSEQQIEESQLEEEKSLLLISYFGNFTRADQLKEEGKKTLRVWPPYTEYAKTLPARFREVMTEGVTELPIEYDEIWVAEQDEGFTSFEKKEWKGEFDLVRLYWKENKIQGAVLERWFIGNPLTGEKLANPGHRVRSVYDRDYILANYDKH